MTHLSISIRNGILIRSLLFFLLPVSATFAGGSDTTYGDFRVKEKEKRAPDNPDQNTSSAGNNDSDTGSGCLSSCGSACFDFGADIIVAMFRRIGNAIEKGRTASVGGVDFSRFADRKFRHGVGAGAGMLDYPRIATGFQPKAIAHFYFIPSGYVCFRANTGLDFSINSINADFEHDVFVDTGRIGIETIRPESYQNLSMPFSAEIMVRPFGDFGSFHFFAGGGGLGVFERIKGTRTASYTTAVTETTSMAFHIQPVVSFGIGWLLVAGERLGNLEFRYSESFSDDRHHKPIPGDNAPDSRSFCIEYTGLF
jgi:hypothetical protein